MSSATSSALSTADAIDPAGIRLVETLRRFEEQLDATYAIGGELAVALVRAKTARGLSSTAGHQVFRAIDRATSSVVEARGHAVAGHRLLEEMAQRMGIDIRAYGDVQKDPDFVGTGG